MKDAFQRQLDEKIRDDEDFLSRYGSVRTRVPGPRYKEGWDRIFNRGSSPNGNPCMGNSPLEPKE